MGIESLRKSFRPNRIRLLLIGESAPKSGDFFYKGCRMTTHTKKPFEKVFKKSFSGTSDFLEFFKKKNCYLEDLCQIPVDGTTPAERNRIREESIKDLTQRLKKQKPKYIAIVGKEKKLKGQIEKAIKEAGLSCPIYILPFAGNSWQNEYEAGLEEILRKLFKQKT